MFTNFITTCILFIMASIVAPVSAWGSILTVKSPKAFATSTFVTAAVREIVTSHYTASTSPSDADTDQLVGHVVKNPTSLAAALSAVSDNSPLCYEAAVLTSVFEASDASCPAVQAEKNDRKKKKTTKDAAAATKDNSNGGHMNCAETFDICMASCTRRPEVGFFGRAKAPAPGTCTLVCTAVKQGCRRCTNKREIHAAQTKGIVWGIFTRIRISSLELGENVVEMIHHVAIPLYAFVKKQVTRMAILLWTFVKKQVAQMPILLWTFVKKQVARMAILLWTFVKKQLLLPVVHFFTSATIWVAIALIGWLQASHFSRENSALRNSISRALAAAREAEERRNLALEDEAERRRIAYESTLLQDQDGNGLVADRIQEVWPPPSIPS